MMSAHKSVSGQSFLKKDASHICFRISTRVAGTLSLRLSGTKFSQFLPKLVFAEGKEVTCEIPMLPEKDVTFEIPMPEKDVLIDPTPTKDELSSVALYDTLTVAAAANDESSRIVFRVELLAMSVALSDVRIL